MSDQVQTQQESKYKLKGKQWGVMIAVIFMFIFASSGGAVNTTFALIPDWYGVDPAAVSWISASSFISATIAGLVVGAFVGKKVTYRVASIFAAVCFVVFGGLPFLWNELPFGVLLVSRFLFGLGNGAFLPLVQAIVTRMIKNEAARAAWMGVIYMFFSLGGALSTFIGGMLANGGVWQNTYAIYLAEIVTLILVIVFVRDETILDGEKSPAETKAAMEAEGVVKKERIPGIAVAYIIVFALCTLLVQIFFSYAPVAMGMAGLDPGVIGTVLSSFTLIGILVGAINGLLWKLIRIWNYPLSYLLLTVGFILALLAFNQASLPLFFASAIVMGAGTCLTGAVMPVIMSVTVPIGALTLSIGLQEVARNGGSFLNAPWINVVAQTMGDNPPAQFAAAIVLGIVATVLACIIAARTSKRFKNVEMN